MSCTTKGGKYRAILRYKNELPCEKFILWAVKGRLDKRDRKEDNTVKQKSD